MKQQPLMVDSNDSASLNCTCLSVSVMPCKAIPEPFLPVLTAVSVSHLGSHPQKPIYLQPQTYLFVYSVSADAKWVSFCLFILERS